MSDKARVVESSKLPSLPAAASRLLDLLQDPDAGVRDMVEVIKTDPALTAKILQAANASSLGVSRTISSIDLAVPLLGKTLVTTLTLNFSLLSKRSLSPVAQDLLDEYWLGAVVQANAAQRLASCLDVSGEELFLAGLLADLGRLAMIATVSDEYAEVASLIEAENIELIDAERQVCGFDHAEIGVDLAQAWNLPDTIVAAIRTHHADPSDTSWTESATELQKAANISALAADLLMEKSSPGLLERFYHACDIIVGLDEAAAKQFLMEAHENAIKVGELLAARTSTLDDVDSILARATEALVKIALEAHANNDQTLAEKERLQRANELLENRNRQLLEKATRDALTGLPNRGFLMDFLSSEWDRCAAEGIPLGIILADIDRFKSINDQHGHQAGDDVLREVGATIDRVTRTNDIVARYGGEEFVLVAPKVARKDMQFIAERFRSSVAERTIQLASGEELRVTVSVGAAFIVPTPGSQYNDLLEAADRAMYDCKESGRNRCKVVEADSPQPVG